VSYQTVDVRDGDLGDGYYPERLMQEINASLKGNPGRGIPWRLTEHADPADYALDVRNRDSGNGPTFRARNHDDSRTAALDNTDTHGFKITGGAKILSGGLDVAGPAALHGSLTADGSFLAAGGAEVQGSLQLSLTSSTSATAGSASAVPALPQGYWTVKDSGGTNRKIPYYRT
jgi:hypothetical protein